MDSYICCVQRNYKHNLGMVDGKHLINMTKSISPALWNARFNTTLDIRPSPTTLSNIQRRKMVENFHICFQFLFPSG